MGLVSFVSSLLGLNIQTFIIFLAIFLYLFNYVKKESWKNLPPGPLCLPIVGSLPFLGTDIREPLRRLSKKHGDIVTVYLGSRRVIVLNSYEAIREALVTQGHSFSSRPPVFFVTAITEGNGIVSADGSLWREQKRVSMNILREFGMGKSLLEGKIHEEIHEFIESLSQKDGQVINPQLPIMYAVSNVIGSITFGFRMSYDDPRFIKYMNIMIESFEVVGNAGLLNVFPYLQHIPGDFFKYKKILEMADYMRNQFRDMMREHKENPSDTPRDFIDAYLKAVEKAPKDGTTTITDEQLLYIIGDLYGAGTETVTTTLRWALCYLLHYPEVQARVHREIDDVLGPDRLPTMQDKLQLPYVEAVILEVQRLGDVVPLNVPHCTSKDVNIGGYFIPKNTMVVPSLYSLHRDEKTFPEPFTFNPQRFLTEDGTVKKVDQLLPFSIGRRLCLGEGLARMELFLFFTCIMQKFTVSLPPGRPLPDLKGTLHITNEPPQMDVILTRRQ